MQWMLIWNFKATYWVLLELLAFLILHGSAKRFHYAVPTPKLANEQDCPNKIGHSRAASPTPDAQISVFISQPRSSKVIWLNRIGVASRSCLRFVGQIQQLAESTWMQLMSLTGRCHFPVPAPTRTSRTHLIRIIISVCFTGCWCQSYACSISGLEASSMYFQAFKACIFLFAYTVIAKLF